MAQYWHKRALFFKKEAPILRASIVVTHCKRCGTEGGTRTHTELPPLDFESSASTIPPLRLQPDGFLA
jgi:hypothetical protein